MLLWAAALSFLLSFTVLATSVPSQTCIDPATFLHVRGSVETLVNSPAIHQNYLYSAFNRRLVVFDISNPPHPVKLREVPLQEPWHPTTMASYRSTLFVGGLGGMAVVDITEPTMPQGVLHGTSLEVHRLVVHDDYLHVLHRDGYRIYSLENPQVPTLLGDLQTERVYGSDLAVNGSVAVVDIPVGFHQDGRGLQIVDIGDPQFPTRATVLDSSTSTSVVLDGELAYLVSSYRQDIRVVDLSNPNSPRRIVQLPIPGQHGPHDPFLSGSLLFVHSSRGLGSVFDVSEPNQPVLKARFRGWFGAEDEYGNLFGNTGGVEGSRLRVLGNSQHFAPAPPAPIAHLSDIRDVSLVGGILHAIDGSRLHLVDLSTPSAPTLLGTLEVAASTVASSPGKTYVGDANFLRLIDTSDPENPTLISSIKLPHTIVEIELAQSRLLVATREGFLLTVDISNDLGLRTTSSIRIADGGALRLKVSEDFAFLVATAVHVVDIRSPDSPRHLGARFGCGGATSVVAGVPYGYALDEAGHLFDFSVRSPEGWRGDRFVEDVRGEPLDGDLEWPFLYVATRENTVSILDLRRDAPHDIHQIPLDPQQQRGEHRVLVQDGLVISYGSVVQILPAACLPTTPVTISDLQATPRPHGILLNWRLLDHDGEEVQVQRAGDLSGPGPFSTIGLAMQGHQGRYEFLDTEVRSGSRHFYRIVVVARDGSKVVSRAVQVQAQPSGWSLQPVAPNPAHGPVTLRFSIPRLTTPRLSIYDAAGRLVRRIEVGLRVAGTHGVHWDGRDDRGSRVAPGLYYARLDADRGTLSRSVLVLR